MTTTQSHGELDPQLIPIAAEGVRGNVFRVSGDLPAGITERCLFVRLSVAREVERQRDALRANADLQEARIESLITFASQWQALAQQAGQQLKEARGMIDDLDTHLDDLRAQVATLAERALSLERELAAKP